MRRIMLSTVLIMTAAIAAADTPEPTNPHAWNTAMEEPLRLYERGAFPEAAVLARQIAARSTRETIARDAALLEALCLLNGESREDMLNGRQRLAQLAAETPALTLDPECNLAMGITQTRLHETADALDRLDRATRAFRTLGRAEREAAALAALAGAWATHAEWERTSPRLLDRMPRDPADADAIRMERIRAARSSMLALPESARRLDQIDVVLARFLIDRDQTVSEGRTLLESLAGADPLTPAGADAALTLAGLLERASEVPRAIELYERLTRQGPPPLRIQAAARLEALRRPSLELIVPQAVRCGSELTLDIRARGLRSVRLELRSVDIDAWLARSQPRGSDASLPEAGPVIDTVEMQLGGGPPGTWWDSRVRAATWRVSPPSGAYVALTRARDDSGGELNEKRLVFVTDLDVTCVLGGAHALVWVRSASGGEVQGKTQFWMQRSFVPTESRIEDGIARFALPAEAAVMRERAWSCLIRVGDQIALCRGELADPRARQTPHDRPMIVAGPAQVRPDEPLYIAGILPMARPGEAPTRDIQLRAINTMNDVIATLPLEPTASGAIDAMLTFDRSQAGRRNRLTLHRGNTALENDAGRLAVEIAEDDPHALDLAIDAITWPLQPDDSPAASVDVRRSGGEPASGTVAWRFDALRLPESVGTPLTCPTAQGSLSLGATPGARLALPIGAADAGPLLAQLTAAITTSDGSRGVGSQVALRSGQRSHAWLEFTPVSPNAGDDITFRLGGFSLAGWALLAAPSLQIDCPDGRHESLAFEPGPNGFQSAPWRPTASGEHRWTIRAADDANVTGEPFGAEGVFSVGPGEPGAIPVRCRATIVREADLDYAEVEVIGNHDGPLLVIVGDTDVLGGATIAYARDSAPLRIALSRPTASAMVRVLNRSNHTLATCGATRRDDQRPRLAVEPQYARIWPGDTFECEVMLDRVVPDAVVVARLIAAADAGRLQPTPSTQTPPPLQLVASGQSSELDAAAAETRLSTEHEAPLRTLLLEGDTLWCTARSVESKQLTLRVPAPRTAGRYLLLVGALLGDREFARGAALIETASGVRLDMRAPSALSVDDKCRLTLQVDNRAPRDRHVTLELEATGPVALGSCTGLSESEWRTIRDDHVPARLHISPGRRWIVVEITAASAGSAEVRATLRGDDGETTARVAIAVSDAPQISSGEPPFEIRRAITVWDAPGPHAVPPSSPRVPIVQQLTEAGWIARAFDPNQPLRVGQVLHVVETMTIVGARPPVAWKQLVPPVCVAWQPPDGTLRLIGEADPMRGQSLGFRTAPLSIGTHTHEYLLGIAAPGTALLPPPALDLLGRPLRVAVTPPRVVLSVSSETAATSP